MSTDEFGRLVEPHRRELAAHCYRMLGSFHDAEDMVQETMLRAWRRRESFQGRSSLRTWLYRIATNACLDVLATRPRRELPMAVAAAGGPPAGAQTGPPPGEVSWLDPLPGEIAAAAAYDPASRYERVESVTLAFTAALQRLSPRQRAVLILRDVLAWHAQEVADLLEESLGTVNSLLFRARRTMERSYATGPPRASGDVDSGLLRRYVAAWETADVTALVTLLRDDVRLSMPPMPLWFAGRDAVEGFLRSAMLGEGSAGRWRFLPTSANGVPAFGVYGLAADGTGHEAAGVSVVAWDGPLVVEITSFLDPGLVRPFGLPERLPAPGG